nr:hypothetical protein [Tanacetum cinerariifolium]
MLGHGDGCCTGEWIWAKDGEAGVGVAVVGDCWDGGSVGCCWCGKGSVCLIVGVVRVKFGRIGCKSKVKATIPSMKRGVKDKPQVGRVSPKVSKVIGSESPRSKWVIRDMITSTKHGVKVVNAHPTLSMFHGTFVSDEDRWKSFSTQVSAQFKDNVNGLALNGIDLGKSDSGATYDSNYKTPCDLLKKLFAPHLKLYGHKRHSMIGSLKTKIPKLKWKTKINFKDCCIFTMLHMESYIGQIATTWKLWACC